MQFQATSIGSAVPRDHFNATIQSLFDSSLNLRLEHEDRLITILVSDHYNLPQGIRLEKMIPLHSVSVNRPAASRGGILRFAASSLTIDLRSASLWEGRFTSLTGNIEPAWSIIWQMLNEDQRLKNTELIADDLFQADQGPLLTRTLSRPVLQLITAAERFEPHAANAAAQKMIGLGPGVTPSGDDVLIGFLAGLHSTAGNDMQRQNFIREFGNALLLLSKETNEISHTYLYHAVHGQFSSSLITLLEAIYGGDEDQLVPVAKAAMRVGHSSGMDSLTGLLIGLTVWSSGVFKTI